MRHRPDDAQPKRNWLAGAMELHLSTDSSTPTCAAKFWLPNPVLVRWRLPGVTDEELSVAVDVPSADPLSRRKRKILGTQAIYCGAATLALRQAATLRMGVTTSTRTEARASRGGPGSAPADREEFQLDVSLRKLRARQRANGWAAFWLMTHSQKSSRFEAIVRHCRLDRRDDYLAAVYEEIASGLDSPLLTEFLDDHEADGGRDV